MPEFNVVSHTCDPSTGEEGAENQCELSLVYVVRLASKEQNTNKKRCSANYHGANQPYYSTFQLNENK